jgi:hypothetical protein
MICKTRYKKMVKQKDMPFLFWRIYKWTEGKKNSTFRNGDLNSRFSVIFPPMI